VTLDQLFVDRPDVLKYVSSKEFRDPKKTKYLEVDGPYTARGHYEVLANIKEAKVFLDRESWVVPLTQEEKDPDKIAQNISRLATDYEARYIDSWKSFCLDVDVRSPANLNEAQELYAVLKKEPWPYLRILRAVEDHTQWKKDFNALESEQGQKMVNRKLNQKLTSKTGLRFNVDVKQIAGKTSTVPPSFQKTVAFGVPEDGARTPLNETPLANYMDKLGVLREKMAATLDRQPTADVNLLAIDLQNAVREIDASLQNSDDMARRCLLPLLMNPLNVAGRIRIPVN
jgi:type VI secretion system protein ImpL